MGFIFRLIKLLIRWTIYLLLFITLIVLIPNLPPYTKFTSIELEPTQQRIGPLAPNGALNNIEKLYVDKLLGPEAFQLYNGEVYTSLATGEIVKVSPGGHVTFVTKIGQPCTGVVQEHICGRPLGFKIDEKNNQLYVADGYHGIWKVDLKTDKKQLLVSPRVDISGRKPKVFNDLVVTKNGDLYWTDSSSDFQLKDGAIGVFTDPSGRLFYYNAAKNESKVLLDDLWFPNGVAISPDNQFIVVVESFKYRLLKYYIDGPKKGKSEVFVAGLPGIPDNVRYLPDHSGVLVALYTAHDDENPLILRSIAQTPALRKFLARIQRLIEMPFEFLNNQYPHPVFEDIVYHIGHFNSLSGLTSPTSGLVQIDWNGNIVASYYNTDGSVDHISDAIVHNNKLYLGCPNKQNFIAAVPVPTTLKKALTAAKTVSNEIPKPKVEVKPPQAKPVESPKSKVEEKIERPKQAKPIAQEQPKSTPTKPVTQESKPAQQKPADTGKTTTPKPTTQTTHPPKTAGVKPTIPAAAEAKPTASKQAEKKPNAPAASPKQADVKPTTQPKQAEAKPTTPPKQAEAKLTTPPKQAEAKPTTPPKQAETKPTTPPKQAEAKPTTPPKQTEAKPTTPSKQAENKPVQVKTEEKLSGKQEQKQPNIKTGKIETSQKAKTESKPAPEEIPIKEEIPSDTAKPTKDKLKVIKKNGPAEIPNPNI